MKKILTALIVLFVVCTTATQAQTRKGDVTASAGYSAHFYRGDFDSDRAGDGGMFTLSYNTSDRFWLEGRIGFGSYHWQTSSTLIKKYDDYYGPGGTFGGSYPGSLAKIESNNQAGLTTLDVTFGYILIPNKSFTPFISGGFGLVHFTPRNSNEGAPLPNYDKGVYPSSVASFPLGLGVMVPLADQLALTARYDYRLVFSGFLDDYEFRGENDGLSALTIGLSYRFNERSETNKGPLWCEQCKTWYDVNNCAICAAQNCEICRQKLGQGTNIAANEPAPAPAPAPATPAPAPQPQPEPPAPEPVKEAEPIKEPTPAAKKKLNAQGIRFNVNSDVIDFTDPTTRTRMNEMLDYLTQDCEDLEVLVEGHASVDGPAKRNQELSVMRARSVAKWLLDNGVEPERIKGAIGYGSSMPRVPDPSPAVARKMTKQQLEAIREQNRRIELSVLKDCE